MRSCRQDKRRPDPTAIPVPPNSVNGRRTPFSRATTLVLSADIGNSIDERFCCQDRTLLGGSSRKKLLDIAMSKLVPANYLVECAQNENRSFENGLNGQRL